MQHEHNILHNILHNADDSSPHLLNRRHIEANCGEVYLSNTATLGYLTKGGRGTYA